MNASNFSSAEDIQQLATEVSCLKALLTHMLKAMGQADAGKIIVKMEKEIAQIEDPAHAEIFSNTIQQVKQAYRQ